ncbi:hypothetical protein EDD37DRAFT_682204 [Exophiala viscosa]|uniref:uncharacterized protein n=1 Tax=Exophiala viscosa TaxID=2486360 RepID=UPI00219D530D|nr:hypothetical protein EDD37DRAFT_682204 [Exophiala viscosa]
MSLDLSFLGLAADGSANQAPLQHIPSPKPPNAAKKKRKEPAEQRSSSQEARIRTPTTGTRVTSRRDFRCTMCDRAFARVEHLTRHERAHSNEKPFECRFCNYRFSRKDSARVHLKRYHKEHIPPDGEFPASDILKIQTTVAVIPESQSSDITLNDVTKEQPGPETIPGSSDSHAPFGSKHIDTFTTAQWTFPFEFNGLYDNFDWQQSLTVQDLEFTLPATNSAAIDTLGRPITNSSHRAIDEAAAPKMPRPGITILDPLPLNASEIHLSGPVRREWFEITEAKRMDLVEAISNAKMETICRHVWHLGDIYCDLSRGRAAKHSLHPCPYVARKPTALGFVTCYSHHRRDLLRKCGHRFILYQAARQLLFNHASLTFKIEHCGLQQEEQPIWVTQTLLFVMIFGAWSGKSATLHETVTSQSLLASLVRSVSSLDEALGRHNPNQEPLWESWVAAETIIR